MTQRQRDARVTRAWKKRPDHTLQVSGVTYEFRLGAPPKDLDELVELEDFVVAANVDSGVFLVTGG